MMSYVWLKTFFLLTIWFFFFYRFKNPKSDIRNVHLKLFYVASTFFSVSWNAWLMLFYILMFSFTLAAMWSWKQPEEGNSAWLCKRGKIPAAEQRSQRARGADQRLPAGTICLFRLQYSGVTVPTMLFFFSFCCFKRCLLYCRKMRSCICNWKHRRAQVKPMKEPCLVRTRGFWVNWL